MPGPYTIEGDRASETRRRAAASGLPIRSSWRPDFSRSDMCGGPDAAARHVDRLGGGGDPSNVFVAAGAKQDHAASKEYSGAN